ncbi:hypothetical protein O181_054587 [Austropuccinia psidii MF-1]|uniref:Integrase catalytic domain-containing protein n=1 Tax=Austropuccinia psidii MF-1 TaxID=1389203 RepID=A0A9Q3HSN5_9BASI|nr:hypothetical protein [Austropuccinia psidii MF-1]
MDDDTMEDSNLLLERINEQYALKTAINQGRVVMEWVAIAYKGNLDDFIKKCRKALVDLALVKIKIPSDVLSYMILGNLCDHTSMYHLGDILAMSTKATENPTVNLNRLQNYARHLKVRQKDSVEEHPNTAFISSSSSHPSKPGYYCANGVHNPLNISHMPSICYIEFPHLWPKKKEKDNENPSTHLLLTQALVTITGFNRQKTQIIIDSAATHHIFSNKSLFTSLKKSSPFIVSTGDPTSNLYAEGVGSVSLIIEGKTLILENFILVPKISHNLISLLELLRDSVKIEKLSAERFVIKNSNETILSGKITNLLMTVLHQPVKAFISVESLWHQRLGHPSNQIMKTLGLPPPSETCEVCLTGKLSLIPFSESFDKDQHPLKCVNLDVVGPISRRSNTGLRYFLTIVDQFTLFKTVMFLKTKREAFNKFVKLKEFSKNFHNTRIKNLVSNRGGEFENEWFKDLATSCGFIHIFSPTATSEHNGFAEWVNRTILDKARCLLIRSNLPRTFGCKTFILVQQKDRDWKLAPTSEEGILLGFQNDNSSYQILQLREKTFVVTRHALFIEDHFPFLDKGSDCTDFSRWVNTGDENDIFFDCNEDAIEDSNSRSPPDNHHDVAIQESHSSAVDQTCQNIIPNNPHKIMVIGP